MPEASVGVVLSGSSVAREFVQRLGRLLRKSEGKRAVLYEVVSRATREERVAERRRQGVRVDSFQLDLYARYFHLRGRPGERLMLPAELLQYTQHSGQAYPRFLQPERGLPWAEQVLETLSAHRGKTRCELDEALLSLEGDSPDYRVVRGLTHLALAEATLEVKSPVVPEALRWEAFLCSGVLLVGN